MKSFRRRKSLEIAILPVMNCLEQSLRQKHRQSVVKHFDVENAKIMHIKYYNEHSFKEGTRFDFICQIALNDVVTTRKEVFDLFTEQDVNSFKNNNNLNVNFIFDQHMQIIQITGSSVY